MINICILGKYFVFEEASINLAENKLCWPMCCWLLAFIRFKTMIPLKLSIHIKDNELIIQEVSNYAILIKL